jgi:hypothetical protein
LERESHLINPTFAHAQVDVNLLKRDHELEGVVGKVEDASQPE